jgi:hypothetical protein
VNQRENEKHYTRKCPTDPIQNALSRIFPVFRDPTKRNNQGSGIGKAANDRGKGKNGKN